MPGLAKTLMIRTLADALSLTFSRIQFTPDLMPSDITGTEVIQEDKRDAARASSSSCPGPIFANVILADEINRTPPKTQAALLEAMQEHQVTVGGTRHRLPEPFFVLATQNPIEQEGTYPLPEAQLDRFMFNVLVDYPERGRGAARSSGGRRPTSTRKLTPTLTADEILALQEIVRKVPVADHVVRYALQFARLTRSEKAGRARLRPRLRELGGRPAGQPVPGPGGQGAGRAARPVLRHAARTSAPSPRPCCGTASSPTSTPRPKASSPTTSSGG